MNIGISYKSKWISFCARRFDRNDFKISIESNTRRKKPTKTMCQVRSSVWSMRNSVAKKQVSASHGNTLMSWKLYKNKNQWWMIRWMFEIGKRIFDPGVDSESEKEPWQRLPPSAEAILCYCVCALSVCARPVKRTAYLLRRKWFSGTQQRNRDEKRTISWNRIRAIRLFSGSNISSCRIKPTDDSPRLPRIHGAEKKNKRREHAENVWLRLGEIYFAMECFVYGRRYCL